MLAEGKSSGNTDPVRKPGLPTTALEQRSTWEWREEHPGGSGNRRNEEEGDPGQERRHPIRGWDSPSSLEVGESWDTDKLTKNPDATREVRLSPKAVRRPRRRVRTEVAQIFLNCSSHSGCGAWNPWKSR